MRALEAKALRCRRWVCVSQNWPKTFLTTTCSFCDWSLCARAPSKPSAVVWIQDLPRKAQKAALVHQIDVIGQLCFLCFVGSLFFFLLGFALFGVSKFNPTKTQPLLTGLFGLIAIIVGGVVIFRSGFKAKVGNGKSRSACRPLPRRFDCKGRLQSGPVLYAGVSCRPCSVVLCSPAKSRPCPCVESPMQTRALRLSGPTSAGALEVARSQIGFSVINPIAALTGSSSRAGTRSQRGAADGTFTPPDAVVPCRYTPLLCVFARASVCLLAVRRVFVASGRCWCG